MMKPRGRVDCRTENTNLVRLAPSAELTKKPKSYEKSSGICLSDDFEVIVERTSIIIEKCPRAEKGDMDVV